MPPSPTPRWADHHHHHYDGDDGDGDGGDGVWQVDQYLLCCLFARSVCLSGEANCQLLLEVLASISLKLVLFTFPYNH